MGKVTMNENHWKMFAAVTFLLGNLILASSLPFEDYMIRRHAFLHEEELMAIGGNLTLSDGERSANKILMEFKKKEIDLAFSNSSTFLPAKNFLQVLPEIEESEVLRIIKKMPKGALLHAHSTAFVSSEWIYQATFRENLYICDKNDQLSLRFFVKPTADCNWKLLSELRKDPNIAKDLNKKIQDTMTMIVPDPDQTYHDQNSIWEKLENIIILLKGMLTYRPLYEDYYYEGLKQLYEDNVMYLELRSTLSPLYELNGTIHTSLKVVEIYKQVGDRFKQAYPDFIGVKLIYSPYRQSSTEKMKTVLSDVIKMKLNFPTFFAGFDIVGQEDKGKPLIDYANEFKNIGDHVELFFHAGETNWYGTSSDENLIDAILLNTKRIGHGFALLKHPKVMEAIKQKDIAVEVCPISNQVLGLIKDLRNHPASILFAQGFPVVVSNDDPSLWGSKALSYDFYEAFMGIMSRNADIRALKQLAMNSIVYSTLNGEEKTKAMESFHAKWAGFISKLNQ